MSPISTASIVYMKNRIPKTPGLRALLARFRHRSDVKCVRQFAEVFSSCTKFFLRASTCSDMLDFAVYYRYSSIVDEAPCYSFHSKNLDLYLYKSTLASKSLLTKLMMKSAGLNLSGHTSPANSKAGNISLFCPSNIIMPLLKITSRSKCAHISELGQCMLMIITAFIVCAILLSARIIWYAEAESSPLVGSSRTKMLGRLTSSTATDSRRFYPPEIPFLNTSPMRVFSVSESPVRFKISVIIVFLTF